MQLEGVVAIYWTFTCQRTFHFFMALAAVADSVYARGGLYRSHRLYNCDWDWNFWGRLMGRVDGGWLESWVCLIVVKYVKYIRYLY